MALQDKLIKISIDGLDTTGLYYKDSKSIFSKKQLSRSDLKKLDYTFMSIIIKFYFRNKQMKKTVKYNNITGLQAVKKAISKRIELREELEENGMLEKKHFVSLHNLFIEYKELKSKTLSDETIYNMEVTYSKWIKKVLGNVSIQNIKTSDIQKIVNKMLKDGKKPRTAQTIKQILRPLFNYAIDLEIVQINPAVKVNIPSYDNTVNFELSDDKRTDLYHAILEYPYKKYRGIMLFLYFGRRLNEVLTLQWRNINFDQMTYTIEDVYSKIRRRQEYPLLKPLQDFLEEYGSSNNGYIFKGEKTKHVTKNTFRHHWEKVIQNAGIKHMRIHDTRHLLGNTLVNNGESLENIGKVLGHSSIAVTKRYAKTTLETADRLLNGYLEDSLDS
ncbi:tyrosine-type recombinase/integrase [Sulfurimonas indica]|uniref:tyrosine-type recombinase/integrase n=1 Tax=Sulfurimonas indica TaxID=2508707 RepID=UPI0012652BC8|nr:site-specific integrase [Sulfurimonas indica]